MTIKDKLPAGSPLGFASTPIGSIFRAVSDQGTRFFDTAPFYGARLAELRLGDSFALSTKVLLLDLEEFAPDGFLLAGRHVAMKNQELVDPAAPLPPKDPS
jgi:hypothetical protein